MKRLLIDKNIHQACFKLFLEYQAKTIGFMKWNGISNGKLLERADGLFDVLLTADQNIPCQQSLANHIQYQRGN
jgi:hypothetical protein